MLGDGFRYFLFSPRTEGKIPILTHIFRMGWFNHQPEQQHSTVVKVDGATRGPKVAF